MSEGSTATGKPIVRSYTAVFTIEHTSDVDLPELLAHMQEGFDTQWAQTAGSGMGWTVTIHEDDEIVDDPRDRYGSPEHEAWLIEMERQEG